MRAGTEITLTLVFARAGTMTVAATVTNPETGGSNYLATERTLYLTARKLVETGMP
jgi:copper(I)-binding protein